MNNNSTKKDPVEIPREYPMEDPPLPNDYEPGPDKSPEPEPKKV